MKRVTVRYGIGYGSHIMDLEFEDDATTEDIEAEVRDFVMERLDWGFTVEDQAIEGKPA